MLGGTPRCAACGQLAYHAEQVMGPARKIYHKPCLKCHNCEKRLDPGSLVEHDAEPYCRRCHGLSFGTKDLRSANVFSALNNAPPTTPPRNASQQSSPRFKRTTSPVRRAESQLLSAQASSASRTNDAPALASLPSRRFSHQAAEHSAQRIEETAPSIAPGTKRPLPTPPPKPLSLAAAPRSPSLNMPTVVAPPVAPLLPTRPGDDPPTAVGLMNGEEEPGPATRVYTSIDELLNEPSRAAPSGPTLPTHLTSREPTISASTSTQARPAPDPSPTTHAVHRNDVLATSPYRSKPIMPGSSSGNEGCAGCGKTVYFAEGVNAIGKRWHKPCLRCTSCRSTLDPGRVQDRDELPYCKNCYTRDFGPTVLR
ncbi:hypothetical protein NCC49_003052 [Naganishia albida]|nr:hypothetical protein NCC49_003052 [Naganishia albida]